MELILPDTNAWVAYFVGQEPVAEIIAQAILAQKVVVSVVVASEFLIKATPEQKRRFYLMIGTFGVEDINLAVAEAAVQLRQGATKKSKKAYLLDCFIAATAKLKNATVLTFDRRDFALTGVKIMEMGRRES